MGCATGTEGTIICTVSLFFFCATGNGETGPVMSPTMLLILIGLGCTGASIGGPSTRDLWFILKTSILVRSVALRMYSKLEVVSLTASTGWTETEFFLLR